MWILAGVGLLLVLIGTGCAIGALISDYRAHASQPMWPRLVNFMRRVRHLFRRRRIVSMSAEGHVATSLHANLRRGPIQFETSPDDSIEHQLELVTRRLLNIEKMIEEDRSEHDELARDLRTKINVMGEQSAGRLDQLEELARSVATGTAKLQVFGLTLVGLGSIFLALPTFLS